MQLEIFKYLIRLKQKNQNIYLVGGAIRDFLLERNLVDLDFVVTKNVLYIANKFAQKFKTKLIVLDDVNRIYRIVLDKQVGEILTVDFSLMRGRNIYEDLSGRDFTINAIALQLPTASSSNQLTMHEGFLHLATPLRNNLIDPYNGRLDITKKIVRHISEKNFVGDPLRLLRAYRLKAELKFNISRKTKKVIEKYSYLVSKPAKERIRDELIKIFQSENSYKVLDELDKVGIGERIFPEIKKIKQSTKKHYFHPQGLWQHSKLTLKSLERILCEPERFLAQEITSKTLLHISNRTYLLKLISLFHDISKPQTVKKISGRTRFFGHETSGAKQIGKMLTRLHFSKKDIQIAQKIVKNHMRPGSLAQSKILTQKALYRFFRDLGDESVDLLIVSLADRMSYVGISTNQKEIDKHKNFVSKLIEKFFEHKERQAQPKLIDGYVVMNKFGLSPGPIIGSILKLVEENQAVGKINSQEEAIELIRKHLPKLIRKQKVK
ncbi:MAG: HD domain-containing protein [Elusimicrobiota bacterium]|nr:HD domain-containing protein [Elusimicrobiota bacterium]